MHVRCERCWSFNRICAHLPTTFYILIHIQWISFFIWRTKEALLPRPDITAHPLTNTFYHSTPFLNGICMIRRSFDNGHCCRHGHCRCSSCCMLLSWEKWWMQERRRCIRSPRWLTFTWITHNIVNGISKILQLHSWQPQKHISDFILFLYSLVNSSHFIQIISMHCINRLAVFTSSGWSEPSRDQ